MIKAELKVLGRWFEAKGETPEEAISNLNPGTVRGSVVLRLSNGDKSKDRVLLKNSTKYLFGKQSPTFQQAALKNVVKRFDKSLFENAK